MIRLRIRMVRLLMTVVNPHTHTRLQIRVFMNPYGLCDPCPSAASDLICI